MDLHNCQRTPCGFCIDMKVFKNSIFQNLKIETLVIENSLMDPFQSYAYSLAGKQVPFL